MNKESIAKNAARREELKQLEDHDLLVELVDTVTEIRDLLEMALEEDDE